jgi:hypothetical protein
MPIDKLIAVLLPIALCVLMIGAGLVNFVGPGSVRDSFARWGYPAGFHRVTGGLEVTQRFQYFTNFNGTCIG